MMFLQVNPTYNDMQALISGLYNDMIPLASQLIQVGQGIAGLGGVVYIFYRLWPVLAGNEPLDFYPLMRPFAIFLCLIFYMGIVDLMNAVLAPVSNATTKMIDGQNVAVIELIKRKEKIMEEQMKLKKSKYVKQAEEEGWLADVAAKVGVLSEYIAAIPDQVETSVRKFVAWLLELLFYAAGLMINAIRTFYLIILVMIGPLALGFSVFPGFEGTFQSWIARYIQIYMWLPIANILGTMISKIQVLMVEQDISKLTAQKGFLDYDGSDLGYMIFLLLGIISYMTIPSVAAWIVESSGAGRAVNKATQKANSTGQWASAKAGHYAGGGMKGIADASKPGYSGIIK